MNIKIERILILLKQIQGLTQACIDLNQIIEQTRDDMIDPSITIEKYDHLLTTFIETVDTKIKTREKLQKYLEEFERLINYV